MPTPVPSTDTQNYRQFSICHANGWMKKTISLEEFQPPPSERTTFRKGAVNSWWKKGLIHFLLPFFSLKRELVRKKRGKKKKSPTGQLNGVGWGRDPRWRWTWGSWSHLKGEGCYRPLPSKITNFFAWNFKRFMNLLAAIHRPQM